MGQQQVDASRLLYLALSVAALRCTDFNIVHTAKPAAKETMSILSLLTELTKGVRSSH